MCAVHPNRRVVNNSTHSHNSENKTAKTRIRLKQRTGWGGAGNELCVLCSWYISPFVLRGDYLVCSTGNLKSSLERVFKDAAVVAACPLSLLTAIGWPHKATKKEPHRGNNKLNLQSQYGYEVVFTHSIKNTQCPIQVKDKILKDIMSLWDFLAAVLVLLFLLQTAPNH